MTFESIPIPESKVETEKEDSFERQWANPEKVKIGEREIEIEDIKPENGKTAVPTIIGLGWSERPEAHKGNIKTFVDKGRRVISPDTPHGIEAPPKENYPTVELRKMAALVRTLEARGIEKADIVAHSEGAVFSVMAAYFYPERFRSLVLVNPAGMIGSDNIKRLAIGFSSDLIRQVINEAKKEKPNEGQTTGGGAIDALGGTKVLAENPRAAIESVFAMANSDLRNMLIAIKEKGVRIAVIAGVNDRAFPIDKMQTALGLEHVDGFYSVKGTHNSYFIDPKPYSLLIDDALDKLEQLAQKESREINQE